MSTLILISKQDPSSLCDYVFQSFVEDEDEDPSMCSKRPQLAVMTMAPVAIACGYISQYPIATGVMKLPIDADVIKQIFLGGSLLSYGSLYAWGSLNILHHFSERQKPLEVIGNQKSSHPVVQVIYKLMVGTLGLGACLPNAYYAYIFNQNSAVWASVNILGSWGVMTYSIHTMIQEFELPKMRSCYSREAYDRARWDEIRDFLCQQLEQIIDILPELDGVSDFVHDREVEKEKSVQSFFGNIVRRCKNGAVGRVNEIMRSKIVQYPVKGISTLLPISNLYMSGKATWELVGKFTHLAPIKFAATGVALSSSYLTYTLTRDCLLISIKNLVSRCLGVRNATLAEVEHPKKRIVVLTTTILVSLLSSSIDYALAREIFPGDDGLSQLATITSVINCIGLTLVPMLDVSTIVLNRCTVYGSVKDEIKLKANMTQKFEQLARVIKQSSHEELVKFVHVLMENPELARDIQEKFPWIELQE